MPRLIMLLGAMLVLLLAACANTAAPAPPTPTPIGPFVATPIPQGAGVTAQPVQPNSVNVQDPEKTPVVVLGLTVDDKGHEIVTIGNISEKDQDIGGWSVYNPNTDKKFSLPREFVLKPKQVVRVHSGPGGVNNPPTDFLWSEERQWTGADHVDDVILTSRAGELKYWYVAST